MTRPEPPEAFAPVAQVRAAAASAALDRVSGAGHSVEAVCRAVGIEPSTFGNADHMVGLKQVVRLYEECARVLNDPYFGLRLGATGGHSMVGDLSYVARHSPTLGEALRNVERYASIQTRGVRLWAYHDGDQVRVCYEIPDPNIWPRRHDVEATVATSIGLLRSLMPREWAPRVVFFEHEAPADVSPYAEILQTRVVFEQPRNEIHFDARWLDEPIPGADGRLLGMIEAYIAAVLADESPPDEFLRDVHQVIAQQLSHGDVSIGRVAKLLAMSRRSLQRRLAERGVVYRQLLDETRRGLALQCMRDRKRSVTEIAFLLGYSELSAFTRAFRRWTGSSPMHAARSR